MKTVSKKRMGVTLNGLRYEIAMPRVLATQNCPGEAHENAHIDHCMQCLGVSWGKAPVWETFGPEVCDQGQGLAVLCGHETDVEAFEAALERKEVRLVSIDFMTETGSINAMAWVRSS